MLVFLKENGFPCTLFLETEEYKDKNLWFDGYKTIVIDENDKIIKEFNHKEMRDRVHWVDGYFTALKTKKLAE